MLVELTEKELKTLKEAYDAVTDRNNIKLNENYSEDQINTAVDKIERAIYELKQKGNDYFDVFVDDVYSAISEYVYVDDYDDEEID